MSITTLDSKEICLDRSFELSVRPETFQKADSDTESELKIVRVWSMAEEDGSQSVNNSHQHSNVMEQISPIIHADNLSNKSVSNPPEKITDNKASRLERRRERRKDPAFAERERERKREYQRKYQRERRKDPILAERERERQRERQRERRKDPAFAEHKRKLDRERKRERRKDPVFVEGHRIYMNTYNRIKRQTANKEEASKQAKIAKEQYLQTIHSAGNSRELILISNSVETNQSSSKNSDGTPPAIFQSSS
ncbi:hypothetical protein J7438_00415 [Thalassotalea sp. G20_0]|uniref:hypothetical protein n=1 Tax=Thalassotalea sp. G20_0 TaxID=2821093 RepID=UPI001ADA5A97|nr:hypothetical protein [Thalassotalea sp. G20_0]MBO9492560.1 hypothetical protein [Thalassotalea sp. G20_0]